LIVNAALNPDSSWAGQKDNRPVAGHVPGSQEGAHSHSPFPIPKSPSQFPSFGAVCVAWLIYYLRAVLRVQLLKFLFKNNTQKSVKNNQMRGNKESCWGSSKQTGPRIVGLIGRLRTRSSNRIKTAIWEEASTRPAYFIWMHWAKQSIQFKLDSNILQFTCLYKKRKTLNKTYMQPSGSLIFS